MAKYEYKYNQNQDGQMVLNIYLPQTVICMLLSPDIPEHFDMIAMFADQAKLERYVDYLGDDPNRPFVMAEIEAL